MIDDIPTAAQLRDDLRHRIATLERERDEARELLREIAACADEYCGLNYVAKQIPTQFLIRIGDVIKAWKGGA